MIGKTLAYEIPFQLGKGGMGEVFRAKDQKLGRGVAIKVLPEEFARDSDRVARFQREAKLLASLNHPNIAAIHRLEESTWAIGRDGRFLMMKAVESTGKAPAAESPRKINVVLNWLEELKQKAPAD
jgi:serine/threonine protein kinase